MSPSKYVKKPIPVDCLKWTGSNVDAMAEFVGGFAKELTQGESFEVDTNTGMARCEVGDWVIKGVKGELYPCPKDVFEASYQPVPN